jgi:hypothetical protein
MMPQPIYKLENDTLHYWEIWEEEDHYVMHWGVMGEKGEVQAIDSIFGESQRIINKMIDDKLANGYDILDFASALVVVYPMNSNYTNLSGKGEELEGWLSDFLRWRGLGITVGHTENENNLEITCYVIDFKIARDLITSGLSETNFGPCSQILQREIPVAEEE